MIGRGESVYRHRFMGALIGVQLLMILFVNWKSTPRDPSQQGEIQLRSTQEAVLELPPATTHRSVPSSPATPHVLPPRPTDEVVSDPVELPDAEWVLDEPLEIGEGPGVRGESETPVRNPDRPARMTHIVEPPRSDIPEPYRGEIVVNVRLLLNSEGDVVQTELESILTREGVQMEPPDEAWIDQVLEAASRWRFRPAMHGGVNVWSETVIQFYL